MKIFNTIFEKISIGIVFTAVIIIGVVGAFASYQISNGFDSFLTRHQDEFYGYQGGRFQSESQGRIRQQQLVDEFKATIMESILIASLVGISIAIVVSVFVSKQITSPLKVLRDKIKQVSKNEYKEIVMKSSSKEIDELMLDFNLLIRELNRIDRLREDLVSDVTHELNTPITKIVGQLEGCIDGVYKCDKERLKKIRGDVNQLQSLISQLQSLVQIKSRNTNLKLSEVKLKKFVSSIISEPDNNSVKIVIDVPDNISIEADKSKLREILDNLISNAMRHTSQGSISISFENKQLQVIDTGEGIDKKDLPYIFERFYRADKSRDRKTGGLGLGLSIVKELVEIHGWNIEVTSKKGKGTKFTITGIKSS